MRIPTEIEASPDHPSNRPELLNDLLSTISNLPRQPIPRVREFSADTAGEARKAATEWLSDFNQHGPVQIESIRTGAYQGRFIAVVAYWAA